MSYLASKLNVMLKRILLDYKSRGLVLEQQMVHSCRYLIHEQTAWDNLDGGIDGHDVVFFLPEEVMEQIPLSREEKFRNVLASDLSSIMPRSVGEYINDIRFVLADEGDIEFQRAIPFTTKPVTNPDSLAFWTPGQIRLFISHRDGQKAGAHKLAAALKTYGISSFVAHDTIGPMKKWQREILSGLETMEVFLTYLTDDFGESLWCQQEIGFALGKGIPIVSLKLEKADPPGFIGDTQALKGDLDSPEDSAAQLYTIITKALNAGDRLQDGLIAAFVASDDFDQARSRFNRMKENVESLTEAQVDAIVQGYAENESLFKAIYLDNHYNRLTKFMAAAAGGEWTISGSKLSRVPIFDDDDNEVPF
ncbi:toll/interleukin-1 receptor domain-containing protein [Sphingobium lactosutens]|uniref:toll/interleukin-1 receptor domain-containing protein n=1 Tax=Sphingobium lactosutens TaxID=522773 RepID=UPI001D193C45|nr:toll/interleukin-1 receptor domain-containing protein [Sphingobium lactosutens]MCC4256993.1 toll/interleukin-1 receptor domain-containing protein [Sphingobium lactosutens]